MLDRDLSLLRQLTPAITPVLAGTKAHDKSLYAGRKDWKDFAKKNATDEELMMWRRKGAGFSLMMGVDVWALDDDGALPDLKYPPTPTSRGSRGTTRFYRWDPNRLLGSVRAKGWDILVSGHALVAPSIHPSGKPYSWVEGLAPGQIEVAALPPDLQRTLYAPLDKENTSGGVLANSPSLKIGNYTLTQKVEVGVGVELEAELLGEVERDVKVAVALVQALGGKVNGLDRKLHCIRHPDASASAALFQAYDGRILYQEYHQNGDHNALTLGQMYAEARCGRLFRNSSKRPDKLADDSLGPGEAAVWSIRAYHDLLGYNLPSTELVMSPDLPPEDSRRRAYEGYGLLLACQIAYDPANRQTPIPYSVRFAQRWCQIPKSTAAWALSWLFNNGWLVATSYSRTTGKLVAYGPAANKGGGVL